MRILRALASLRALSILALASLMAVAGLSWKERSGNPRVPASADPSIAEPAVVWDKTTLRTCWGSFSDLSRAAVSKDQMAVLKRQRFARLGDPERQAVREAIEREYTAERTGIEFTGWEDCRAGDGADLILVTAADTPRDWDVPKGTLYGGTAVGHGGIESSRGFSLPKKLRPSYVFLNYVRYDPSQKISGVEALAMTALHEFGHVAGLRHEHARPEAARDPDCRAIETMFGPQREPEYSTREYYGVYDPNSIMNYCYTKTIHFRVGMDFKTIPHVRSISDLPELRRRRIVQAGSVTLRDPSVATVKGLGSDGMAEVHLRIGLSAGDVHALKCLYLYDEETRARICRPDYDPVAALAEDPVSPSPR